MLRKYNVAGELLNNEPGFAPQSVVCKVQRVGADIAIGTGGTVYMATAINTTIFDPYRCFSLANDRFQPTIAGYYFVAYTLTLNGLAASSEVDQSIRKNGSTAVPLDGGAVLPSVSNGWYGNAVTALVWMNGSTDYLEFGLFTTTGGNIVSTTLQPTQVEAFLVGSGVGVAPEPFTLVTAPAGLVIDQQVKYRRDPNMNVVVEGSFINTSATAFTVGTTLFTLPAGYRPSVRLDFAQAIWNSTAATSRFTVVRVDTTGVVSQPAGIGLANIAQNERLMLNGIIFAGEQ